jgi:hypothetical protein
MANAGWDNSKTRSGRGTGQRETVDGFDSCAVAGPNLTGELMSHGAIGRSEAATDNTGVQVYPETNQTNPALMSYGSDTHAATRRTGGNA